jgi:hypothetical protein
MANIEVHKLIIRMFGMIPMRSATYNGSAEAAAEAGMRVTYRLRKKRMEEEERTGLVRHILRNTHNALIAPKSGAPGKIARTEGRANRAVRQTPRMSVSYQFIRIATYLW